MNTTPHTPSSAPPESSHTTRSADHSFLQDMLETESVSGLENTLALYLVAKMQTLGFRARIDEVGNAVGEIGPRDGLEIMLLGHMDTVPGIVPVRREHSPAGPNDLLFGRGAVDAKGPLAAFILAASRTNLPPGVRIVVVGAVEEESATSRGARHIATTHTPDACIIGEPSGFDGITLGYKGRLLVDLTITRAAAHSAGPSASVADDAAAWWTNVRSEAESLCDSPRAFDRVQATLRSINTISDGLSERASLTAGFRLPPGISPEKMAVICHAHAPPDAVVELRGAEIAHMADRSNPVARALGNAIRARGHTPRPKHKTGTSDMNVVGPLWRCPIAAYGPGDSTLDHTPHEHISLAEFDQSVVILTHAIEGMANEWTQK